MRKRDTQQGNQGDREEHGKWVRKETGKGQRWNIWEKKYLRENRKRILNDVVVVWGRQGERWRERGRSN